jgi:hypothetical protein
MWIWIPPAIGCGNTPSGFFLMLKKNPFFLSITAMKVGIMGLYKMNSIGS